MIERAVFVSHSWAYSEHYDTLADWVFGQNWNVDGQPLNLVDTSVPKEDPIHYANNQNELQAAIYARILVSSVVVIPTGMYVNHSNWIQKEIDGAKAYSVPILGVNPWGQEKKSSIVSSEASELVGWNSKSVVDGIWRLAQ